MSCGRTEVARALLTLSLIATLAGSPVRAQLDSEARPAANEKTLPEVPTGEQLEAAGATIGKIVLLKENVFDPSKPGEDNWLYRLANRWHILTRDSVIRQQLLFREGDPFSQRLLEESARLLRENDYLYTAVVEPLSYANGVVDIVVRTRDLWTLTPGASISRSGGENEWRVSLSEKNLLGRGARLRLAYEEDVDRQATTFEFSDRNFGHSWVNVALALSDKSDGTTSMLNVARPFYALETRWSAGFNFLDDVREDRLYELGEEVAEYRHESDYFTAFGGWSSGLENGWVRRWTAGVVYDTQRFSEVAMPQLLAAVPEDRRLVYPFIELELLEDDFEVTSNRDHIGRPEDFYMGQRLTARVGYAPEAFGSDRNSVVYAVDASRGLGHIKNKALFLSATASGRFDGGDAVNTVAGLQARYYNQITNKRLFFVTLDAQLGHELDLENPIELGGNTGLRGYPLRYQVGDASLLFTIEQRYYTDWYPFRLFRVGGAVFADVGRTWGTHPVGGRSLGWLKDAGFGLRFGPTRGGDHEVIHLDIAFPLDGDASIDDVQILLESKSSF
ncbi:MAG TPA: POTRA domain-containing protein [Woeseiaceae bacterium]|nr:POTRA domain-containing protein [Woeseiaceae bacterium]